MWYGSCMVEFVTTLPDGNWNQRGHFFASDQRDLAIERASACRNRAVIVTGTPGLLYVWEKADFESYATPDRGY